MEKPKTAEEIIRQNEIVYTREPNEARPDLEMVYIGLNDMVGYMQAHTRQALEAYRDEILKELPPVTSKDPHKIRFKIGQHILNFNIDDFIK